MNPLPTLGSALNARFDRLWNRGLPDNVHIACTVRWPLVVLALLLVNQLLAPHPAWIILILVIAGLYAAGGFWMRQLARGLALTRTREGSILVAGDVLTENFVLHNRSPVPLLWAELRDQSTLPGYTASRVVACASGSRAAWSAQATCRIRGLYRLGPHALYSADPFALFTLALAPPADQAASQTLAIYPRVAALPALELPIGRERGAQRQTRPWQGDRRAPSVREHRPSDGLRHIHWRHSARHRQLMVTETEIDTGRDLWIVLDLDATRHSTVATADGETSTLETSIIAAASLAADLLNRGARHRVGLLTALNTLPPQAGPGHLWRILGLLAAAHPVDVSLDQLLRSHQRTLGRSLVAITALPETDLSSDNGAENLGDFVPAWVTSLVALRVAGTASSVLLVAPPPAAAGVRDVAPAPPAPAANGSLPHPAGPATDSVPGATNGSPQTVPVRVNALRDLLLRHDIPLQSLPADAELPPVLTHRRTRTVLRTTPSGGVIARQIEEEVG